MIKILETTFLLYLWTSDRYSLPVVPKPKRALESPDGLVENTNCWILFPEVGGA